MDYLPLLFALIAFLYSSIGFGGGSSYLAILSIVLSDFFEIRSTALILNICVVTIGTLAYLRYRIFDWGQFWPFLLLSIPCAYLGASVRLTEAAFFLVLGAALLGSGSLMLIRLKYRRQSERSLPMWGKWAFGGGIGFLSGLSGIGGGIFLSPGLNLVGWANPRTIASLSSVFILANSLSGLLGLEFSGTLRIEPGLTLKLLVGVAIGGFAGAYLSNRRMKTGLIAVLTSVLVLYVGLRLVLLHGFGLRI